MSLLFSKCSSSAAAYAWPSQAPPTAAPCRSGAVARSSHRPRQQVLEQQQQQANLVARQQQQQQQEQLLAVQQQLPAAAAGHQVPGKPHLLQQWLRGPQAGPCLIAAGALACSCISLQVKLFEQHVPPLQVTACSSAVAWLATSLVINWQQQHPHQQQQQQQQQQQPPQGNGSTGQASLAAAPPPAAAAPAAAAPPSAAGSLGASSLPPRTASLLLLRGLLGAATVTAYYAAVEELPLPVAVAIFFFHPVLALLLDAAVSKTRVSPQAAGSCALTVLGVLVIGWHDQLMLHLQQAAVFVGDLGREGFAGAAAAAAAAGSDGVMMGPELSLYGVLMGLVAATANAAAFVVVGLIGREVSPMSVCWWQYCVTTHAAVAVLLLGEVEAAFVQASSAGAAAGADASVGVGAADGFVSSLQAVLQQSVQHLPPQHDLLLLSGVVVANFAGQLLLNSGFQRIDAGRGAAVNTLQVLFANAWDVLLLHSQPSAALLAGSGMIVAGVVGTQQSAEAAAADDASPPPPPQQQQQQGVALSESDLL